MVVTNTESLIYNFVGFSTGKLKKDETFSGLFPTAVSSLVHKLPLNGLPEWVRSCLFLCMLHSDGTYPKISVVVINKLIYTKV